MSIGGAVYVNDGSAPAHHEGGEHEQPATEPTHPADTSAQAEQAHGEGEHTQAETPAVATKKRTMTILT